MQYFYFFPSYKFSYVNSYFRIRERWIVTSRRYLHSHPSRANDVESQDEHAKEDWDQWHLYAWVLVCDFLLR